MNNLLFVLSHRALCTDRSWCIDDADWLFWLLWSCPWISVFAWRGKRIFSVIVTYSLSFKLNNTKHYKFSWFSVKQQITQLMSIHPPSNLLERYAYIGLSLPLLPNQHQSFMAWIAHSTNISLSSGPCWRDHIISFFADLSAEHYTLQIFHFRTSQMCSFGLRSCD